jgi:hypothetical protein
MKHAITVLVALCITMFVLMTSLGGKENTTDKLEPLRVDKLMPPNERVYNYFTEFSATYEIPMKYILRCARLESSYRGVHHVNYAPFEDNLVSTAQAYSVLQVRVVAAREVWPEHNYVAKYKLFPFEFFTNRWLEEESRQNKYKLKHGLQPSTMLTYKTDQELAYLLRYNLRFNIESGVKYMRFLRDQNYSWVQVYSVYNQGWAGAQNINSYARYIVTNG